MEKKKVAVLMATYNGERYLNDQIQSLLRQKNVEIEIIVRDDGSSDGTIELLNEYQNNHVLTWFGGEHKSVADGFFVLLEQSPDADYYAFCDQDDVWDDDKLYCAVKWLEKVPDSDYALYCCGARLVDENLSFICDHKMDKNRTQFARLFFAKVAGNTMVMNKVLRDKVIQYHPENMLLHDTWIYKLALCLGAHMLIDTEPHLNYRQHGDNTVGMELNLHQKMSKFFEIIHERNIYRQLMEIKNVYSKEISQDYLDVLELFSKSKIKLRYRIQLAFDKRIDFNNIFFDLAFKIKIITNSF